MQSTESRMQNEPDDGSCCLDSAFRIHRSAFTRSGYTLVELFLTLAVLMVVLGLMRNLSDRVRRESADRVTRQILSRLNGMMAEYQRENHGQLPPVTPLISPNTAPNTAPQSAAPPEAVLQANALENNADVSRYLRLDTLANRKSTGGDPLVGALHPNGAGAPLILDPWGSPIVFMPSQNPAIGMAFGDAFFFCSAGPDRLFLTHQDNLYSYDANAD